MYFDLNVTDAMVAGQVVQSVVYIDSYQVGTKKDGGDYIFGKIRKLRKLCNFKIWDSNIISFFKSNDFVHKYLYLGFKGSEWNGQRDIVITQVVNKEFEVDSKEFESPLEYEELFKDFGAYISSKLSPNWVQVVNIAFNAIPDVNMFEHFKTEWAAHGMHDAVKGGLLSHTLKMLRIYDVIEENDSRLKEYSDLIRTGIILHDLGKIEEMENGEYKNDAYVLSHRAMGIGYLERNYIEVLKYISRSEMLRLESIILGHHNGLGDSEFAHTIYALIVHLIDNLDAQVTMFMDSLESKDTLKKNGCGDIVISVNQHSLIV